MQKATVVIHVLQALFIPIIMGVTGAAMMQPTPSHSSVKFMFALVSVEWSGDIPIYYSSPSFEYQQRGRVAAESRGGYGGEGWCYWLDGMLICGGVCSAGSRSPALST